MDYEALLEDLSTYENWQLPPSSIAALLTGLVSGVCGGGAAFWLQHSEGESIRHYLIVGLGFGILMFMYMALIHHWIMESYRGLIRKNVLQSLNRGLFEIAYGSCRPRGELFQVPTFFKENPDLGWLIANYNLIARHFKYPIAIPLQIRLIQIVVFLSIIIVVPFLISNRDASFLWMLPPIFILVILGASFDKATEEGVVLGLGAYLEGKVSSQTRTP
ncbi:MAG: hypothetical protein M3R04_06100 [bacterium]|nr:hypothetical protein [bacterium]